MTLLLPLLLGEDDDGDMITRRRIKLLRNNMRCDGRGDIIEKNMYGTNLPQVAE